MSTDYNDRLSDYVDVAERIRIFRDKYPNGSLQPANLEKPFELVNIGEKTFLVYIAAAYRSPEDTRPGIGSAWEPFPGTTPYTKNSELMVAESSAWGRAIVAALAADTKRIASLDEVRARRQAEEVRHPSADAPQRPQSVETGSGATPATEPQERALYAISKKLDKLPPAKGTLSKVEAGKLIEKLQAELEANQ
jgi:hypothetical protein